MSAAEMGLFDGEPTPLAEDFSCNQPATVEDYDIKNILFNYG